MDDNINITPPTEPDIEPSGLIYQFVAGYGVIDADEFAMLEANALTTITAAKKFLGIPKGDYSQDETIALFINSASGYIENYCDRIFGLTEYPEFIPGRDSNRLILGNYPVNEVLEVNIDGTDVELDKFRVMHKEGMLYVLRGRFPELISTGRFTYPRKDILDYNVFVRYTSGYILPKDVTEDVNRNLPVDLEMACLRMIRIMFKDKDVAEGTNLILKREKIGDWMGEYEPEFKTSHSKLTFVDDDVLKVLNTYRRSEYSVW